jgi:hypothetical protein
MCEEWRAFPASLVQSIKHGPGTLLSPETARVSMTRVDLKEDSHESSAGIKTPAKVGCRSDI